MKHTFLVIVGILLIAVMSVQGYYTYVLSEKVDKLSSLKVNLLGFRQKALTDNPITTEQRAPEATIVDSEPIVGEEHYLWDPFTELQQIQEKMNRAWGDSYSRLTLSPKFNELFAESQFSPNVDFTETKQHYQIKVDMPGAQQSSIQVAVKEQQLHISAQTEKQSIVDNQQEQTIRNERLFGLFERTLMLPGPVDEQAMETRYEDGVLTIVLPKKATTPD
ncbi:MAG: Hsp20/alpha crystallin family protein [Pseudomonadota bacterium]|nr:Hsp20/alpha crystallin family protein [Pseudomonadota bacterium]